MSSVIENTKEHLNKENLQKINNEISKKKDAAMKKKAELSKKKDEAFKKVTKNLLSKKNTTFTAILSIIVNILGFFFYTMVWNKQDEYAEIKNGKMKYFVSRAVIMLIYIVLNIYILYTVSLNVCSAPQLISSIKIVITNFILFILLTQFVLYMLPGFLEPFSNILGVSLISSRLFKLNEIMSVLLLDPKEGGDLVQKILEDPSILITSMSPDTIEEDVKKMREDKKRSIVKKEEDWRKIAETINDPEEKKEFEKKNLNVVFDLKKLLRFRDSVSYFTWMILAGFMFISTNVSQIMNITSCAENIEDDINNQVDKASGQLSAINENL